MRTRPVLTAAAVVAIAVACLFSPVGHAADPALRDPGGRPAPNIVLVVADDMAAADLRYMPITRRLIGGRGVSFTNSFSPYSLCCPARVSLLTGQYAHNHGVLGNGSPPFPEGGYDGFTTARNTLATWLDDVGYRTAFVGKYLNGYSTRGHSATVPPGWDLWHAAQGGNYRRVTAYENGVTTTYPDTYRTTWTTNTVTDVIADQVPRSAPLMMLAWYFAPHWGAPVESDDPQMTVQRDLETPVPSRADRDAFEGLRVRRDPSFNEADVSDKPPEITKRPRLDQRDVRGLNEVYQQRLETLQAVDRGVGRIVDSLRAAGELRNSVLVFTSDNGYLLGEHRVPLGKVLAYEPSIRVPLLMRAPGVPAGSRARDLVGTIDIAPTVAQLAGAEPGRRMDGVTLLPLARTGDGVVPGRDLVIEAGPRRVGGPMLFTGLRTRFYTYVEWAAGDRELYDLRTDPYQLENLIGDPSLDPELEQRLADQLKLMRNCAGDGCLAQTDY